MQCNKATLFVIDGKDFCSYSKTKSEEESKSSNAVFFNQKTIYVLYPR